MKRLSTLIIICLCLYTTAALGQAATSLSGTVTDASGLAIRGAQVSIINPSTTSIRQTRTGADGTYVFVELLPGTYDLTVESAGFKKYVEAGIVLRVSLPATANVQMKVGAISETVSVTAEAPPLNTTDPSMGQTMGTHEIENLPLPAENSVLLLSLQPGVAFNGENILTDSYDTRAGMVNGERSDQNNITLDGVSNNNEFAGYAFNGVLPTTPFSVDEFRVTTSNYGASEGRSSGAQISLVTKGGTNQFHGSLYEFNRNGVGEANEFFLKNAQLGSGLPNRPTQLVWNNYGGSIGGPILKNRFFFFFNYEGHRQNVGASVAQTVPSALLQDGIIQYQCDDPAACPGGQKVTGASGKSYTMTAGNYWLGPTQLQQMDPAGIGPSGGILAYFQTYPQPNTTAGASDYPNFGTYRFAAPTTTRESWYIGRLDYKITQNGNHTLFFRGTGVDDKYNNAPFLPGRPPETTSSALSKGFVLGYTSLWGPHVVNNLQYGLTRESVGTNGDSSQPWVFIRDLSQDVAYSSGDTAPVHNIADKVDWNKGSHNFQFGINFLLSRLNSYNYNPVFSDALTNADWVFEGGFANKDDFLNPACNAMNAGSTSCTPGDVFPKVSSGFNHAYDFPLAGLMGIESEVDGSFNYKVGASSASQLPQNQPIVRHWSVDNYNFFFQDTWKVRRNVSLTYGLNYQLMTPMTETAGQEVTPTVNIGKWFNQRFSDMNRGIPDNQVLGAACNYPTSLQGCISFGPAGSVYGKPGLYSKQTRNFAPRFGVAWSPHAESGFLNKLFGNDATSIRAGAGMYYQNFGPELALSYSGAGEYGLSTQVSNPSATLPVANAPRVGSTLSDMNVIPLNLLATYNLQPPSSFNFPGGGTPPGGGFQIAHGIDQSLKTPYSYALDFSVQRQLPGKMTLDVAYVGHFAHRLMALDDVAAPMNLVDPKSGISYFTAARQLSSLWRQNVPEASISASTLGPTAAYWQNMIAPLPSYTLACTSGSPSTTNVLEAVYDIFGPGCGSLYNETTGNFLIDVAGLPNYLNTGPYSFYNSQYSSWWAWRSIAWSNYNALQVSLNKQMSHGVMFSVNYTYSKALDVESTAERGIHYLTDSVINAWSPAEMYGPGDADLRHQISGYWLVELPFGKGKPLASNAHGVADALIGGWRLGGTTRWTSGFPVSVFEGYVWPTNWDEMGWSDLTGAPIHTGTTIINGAPNIFKDAAQWQNTANCVCGSRAGFGYAYPGESGSKNTVRGDGYVATDMNLSKQWKIMESKSLELRWSVFNVFNNTKFDAFSMQDEWDVPSSFGNYSQTLTNPRRMEFAGIFRF